MTDSSQISRASAVDDFRRARRQVAMRDLIGRLTGQPTTLLSYEDVRQKLGKPSPAGANGGKA